jgi:hypothetical protein
MVTEICVSAVFRVIVALRIRLLIFLLQEGYIPLVRSGQAPIQAFVFMPQISCLPKDKRIFCLFDFGREATLWCTAMGIHRDELRTGGIDA